MLKFDHYYYQEPCFGIWGMYQFQLGILSNCFKTSTDSSQCKIKSNTFIDSFPLPGSKRVISMNVIYNHKQITFITCHLDSNPKTEDERERQLECLSSYVFKEEMRSHYVFIGGDFNTTLENVEKHLGMRNLIFNQTDGIFTNYEGECESRIVFDDFVSDRRGLLTTIKF
jgi:endonuclease/exonuclease/phosphatase family metal-dependent hydrolase